MRPYATKAVMLCGLSMFLVSCNDSGFSGSSAPEKQENTEVDDSNNGNVSDTNGNPGSSNQNSNNDNTLGSSSDSDLGNSGNNNTDIDLSDFLNNPNLSQEDTSVTFGANEVFHLGDGNFDASSCKFTVDTFNLSGIKYYFEFQVEEDNTNINIVINRICGVDYSDSNFAALYHNGNQIETMRIPAGSFMLGFTTRRVDAGYYKIEVESRTGSAMGKNDADDFIIGDLNIRGNKRIVRGNFGAN